MKTKKLSVRGLNYHIQEWGSPNKPLLFLLHGWMDCGASFKFIAEYLAKDYFLVAPDWRGFGETDHAPAYWFADYYADLEFILNQYSPDQAVNLIGHSMGGNIALMYAGIRPDRVARVMTLEGLGMPDTTSESSPKKIANWLDEVVTQQETKIYPDSETLKKSIRAGNPSLDEEMVEELTSLWARPHDESGQMRLKHDHAHRYPSPLRYNFDDVLATWQNVSAVSAIVMAEDSSFYKRYKRSGRLVEAIANLPMAEDGVFVVGNASHMLHLEQPKDVAQCVNVFFKSEC